MRDLILATHNAGKVAEIKAALADLPFRVLSADEIPGGLPEVIEDGDTLLANAQKKARAAAKHTGMLALADDSGLEVDALEGAPGVFSARYAGEGCSYEDNNRKLLDELGRLGRVSRNAVFRTVMVLAEPKGREDWAEGRVMGQIGKEFVGQQGFGYDPIFVVNGLGKTFAQLSLEQKNQVSHRGRCLQRMRLILDRW